MDEKQNDNFQNSPVADQPPEPTAPPIQNPVPQFSNFSEPNINIKNLRTYEDDLKDTIEGSKISSAKILMAEQNRRQAEQGKKPATVWDAEQKENRKKKFVAILTALVLVAIAGGIIFVTVKLGLPLLNREAPSNNSGYNVTFLQAEKNVTIDTRNKTSRQIIGAWRDEMKKSDAANNDDLIEYNLIKYVTETVDEKEVQTATKITNADFFRLISARADDALIRSFNPDIMFGAHQLNGEQEPFIIMRINYFDQSFSGMLDWEPRMIGDIRNIFFNKLGSSELFAGEIVETENQSIVDLPETETASTTDAATTTPNEIIDLASTTADSSTSTFDLIVQPAEIVLPTYDPRNFVDIILLNKDVRAIKNSDDEIIFFYTFVDRENLVLTTNIRTLERVMKQLNVAKLIR